MKQMDDPAEELFLKSEKGQEGALCNSLRERERERDMSQDATYRVNIGDLESFENNTSKVGWTLTRFLNREV